MAHRKSMNALSPVCRSYGSQGASVRGLQEDGLGSRAAMSPRAAFRYPAHTPLQRERRTLAAFKIYHNPRCSKSRAALALLRERGIEPQIVEYLNAPPSAAELKQILAQLDMTPEQLVRKSEEVYKTDYAGKALTDSQWIAAMVAHPILIERPIVVSGKRAVLGRPPENVQQLID